jgi:hypothetical protein
MELEKELSKEYVERYNNKNQKEKRADILITPRAKKKKSRNKNRECNKQ